MRRSSGEGTVYRRSCDGRWTAMLSITVNGKRTRKVVCKLVLKYPAEEI
jgi:hypothetical protein